MRSTPLFLGNRLYHLRYDMNAVWDLEAMVTGGFNTIISRDIDMELCAVLLWSGLKWDNPDLTIADAEKMIRNEIGSFLWIKKKLGYQDPPALLTTATSCINELFLAGWYNVPSGVQIPKEKSEPKTMLEILSDMEMGGFYCGIADPWILTPNEINYYIQMYNKRIEIERLDDNYRMANICACVYNSQRKKDSDKVWSYEDFMPRTYEKNQSLEDIKNIIITAHAMLGGK
jgi:hypothetical protein